MILNVLKKIKFLYLLLLINLILYISQVLAYIIKPYHPRLFITENFQKNLKYIQFNKSYKVLVNFCKDHQKDNELKIVNNKYKVLKFIRAYAFLYFISKNNTYMKKIKKLGYILVITGLPKDDQFVRNKLEAAALIYDWCYDGLTLEEKRKLLTFIEDAIHWLERKGYLSNKGVLGGHHYHAHKSALMGAIAIYYKSKYAQHIVKKIMKNLTNHYWPFYKFLSDEDGGFHMWWEYTKYYLWNTCEIFDVWRSATGEDLFQRNKWLNKIVFFLLYGINDDYTVFMTGDNHYPKAGHIYRLLFLKIAKEYNNPYAKWMAEKLKKRLGYYKPFCIYDLLWNTFLVSKSISFLPTSKLFRKVGIVIMKECWGLNGVKPCMSVLFKCTPYYFENHSHRDNNGFEIYYRGYLAIDSGYYDRYGSSHWLNYYIRTIAHNTIIVYDPNEIFRFHNKIISNDGGQKIIRPPRSLDDLLSGYYTIGGIIKYEDSELYTYSIGDASKAYSKNKIKIFRRHFLFVKHNKYFKHPLIIIFDHIEKTSPVFEAKYLLHSVNEPLIKDNIVILQNKNAVLYNYVIYPKSPLIKKIGDPGQEFMVNGKNYPPEIPPPEYAGKWRVEISGKFFQTSNEYFLNVLVINDKNSFYNFPVFSLGVENLSFGLGCIVGNQVFFFSTSEDNKFIAYNVEKNQLLHHFVFNLSPDKHYKVFFNSKPIIDYKLTGNGTLMFDSIGIGKVTIQCVD